MLQAFLQQFTPGMEQVVTLGVPLGVLYAILQRLSQQAYRTSFHSAVKWGFWLSILIVVARVGTRNAVSREVAEGGAIFLAMIAEAVLVVLLLRGTGQREGAPVSRALKISACAMGLLLFFYHGMEIWLIPVGSVIGAAGDYHSAALYAKLGGFACGALFAGLSSYIAYRAASALNDRRLIVVFAVQAVAMLLQQAVFFIQVLMARQVLASASLLAVMGPLIDHISMLIFVIFLALLFVPVALFSQKRPARPDGMNPAMYRKMLVSVLHKRRWGTVLLALLVCMVAMSSFGKSYAYKKAELVPAVPVTAVDGSVDVPLSAVQDGHLHRFVYQASGGEMVRYIVILKGGSMYGVGLDACDICGPTGYYEKDGQVICRLCDVMMNKATIGMKGGCNPIPIEHEVADGKLKIPQAALEAKRDVFR
ncbi:DUF2318 domain-containing protein [uncultured Selenomonas sp.]|uniref:DUF2318 domain-containing protein n=1 Tax=uncultured Selenomonas sp. TaxID=159275 RepID=UPI0025E36094|nr:DUF2318 domain-containing protein [uncultured Selenomonas sp.]